MVAGGGAVVAGAVVVGAALVVDGTAVVVVGSAAARGAASEHRTSAAVMMTPARVPLVSIRGWPSVLEDSGNGTSPWIGGSDPRLEEARRRSTRHLGP